MVDAGSGSPLPGVTILPASGGGATTDRDGTFTVACADSVRLRLSFVGYRPLERAYPCG